MKIRSTESKYLFEQIMKESKHKRILILTSISVDSVCSVIILTTMLSLEHISYSVKPVLNYTSMVASCHEFLDLHGSDALIILINCGAAINLLDVLELYKEGYAGAVVNVYDSHRPIHHSNLRQDNAVVRVQLDEADDVSGIPEYFEDESSDEEEEEEEEEADIDKLIENLNEDDEEEGVENPKKKPRLGQEEEEEEEEEEQEGELVDLNAVSLNKDGQELTAAEKRMQRRHERHLERRILINYYKKQGYGYPIAVVLHQLASYVNKQTRHSLWLATVGLSEHHYLEHIEHTAYSRIHSDLSDQIKAYAQIMEEEGGNNMDLFEPIVDYSFPLLRHWTLRDSMLNSRQVVVGLRTWTDQGELKLDNLLAKVGVMLSEANVPFALMKEKPKTLLRQHLNSYSKEFNLDLLNFETFMRRLNRSFECSSLDVALSISALLRYNTVYTDHKIGTGISSSSSTVDGGDGQLVSGDEALNSENKQKQIDAANEMQKQFWIATDALRADTSVQVELIKQGVELFKKQLAAVVRQGVGMFNRKEVDTRNIIHYAKITSSVDIDLFTHPDHLSLLGMFLLDLVSLKKVSRPLILGVYTVLSDEYLVLGLNGLNSVAQRDVQTSFTANFFEAAHRIGASIKKDAFDCSVVSVRGNDWDMFIEQLVLLCVAESGRSRF